MKGFMARASEGDSPGVWRRADRRSIEAYSTYGYAFRGRVRNDLKESDC